MTSDERYAGLQAQHPGAGPYIIGLLYAAEPSFDTEGIARALQDAYGRVARVGDPSEPKFALPEAGVRCLTGGSRRTSWPLSRQGLAISAPRSLSRGTGRSRETSFRRRTTAP
jgi:hypothetical protein